MRTRQIQLIQSINPTKHQHHSKIMINDSLAHKFDYIAPAVRDYAKPNTINILYMLYDVSENMH